MMVGMDGSPRLKAASAKTAADDEIKGVEGGCRRDKDTSPVQQEMVAPGEGLKKDQ